MVPPYAPKPRTWPYAYPYSYLYPHPYRARTRARTPTLTPTPSQVPPYARVAFANMIALVWNVVLSILANK